MCFPARVRAAFAAWILAAAGFLDPAPAASQEKLSPDCTLEAEAVCINDPPSVFVTPGFSSYTAPDLSVEVRWTDDQRLNVDTRQITLNGADVTGHFGLGWTTPYTAARSVGSIVLAPGDNTLVAQICDYSGQCTSDTAVYSYTPPPPPEQHAAPQISLEPHHEGYRNVAQSSATLSYTTPSYTSLDQARSVTLFYASGQAAPVGFVQVDAIDNSLEAPVKMSIRVINPWGWGVTGENFYQGGGGTSRLAAVWDASGYASGAYVFQVVVRSYWADGSWKETSSPVRVLIVNESASRFGWGWTMVGLQRLHVQADGIMVTEGDGTARFFAATCAGCWGFTAPAGDFTTLVSDGTRYTRTYPDGTRMVFASDGFMEWIEDRFGNRTTYTWTSTSQGYRVPWTITDPAGKQTTFAYHSGEYLASITDPAGRATRTWYSGIDLSQVIDPDGVDALRAWYNGHKVAQWVDRAGGQWNAEYDGSAALSAVTGPQVAVAGGTARPVTRYVGPEMAVLPPAGTGPSGSPAPRVLPADVRVRMTDALGNTTRIQLDRYGQAVRVEEPLGRWTQTTRDPNGLPQSVESSSGQSVRFSWDSRGNLLEEYDHVTGRHTSYDYHWNWNVPTRVSNGESDTWFEYGSRGELLSSRVGSSTTSTTYTTDWRGRVTAVVDPEQHRVEYAYQAGGWENLVTLTRSSSSAPTETTTYAHDAAGRVASVTDAAGLTSHYSYDMLNRATGVTDPAGSVTAYSYGPAYLSRATDPAGKAYQYARNVLGWLESQTDPNGRVTTYAYDLNGNMASRTDRRGLTVSFTYDALNRVASRTADGVTATYGYDNPGGRWLAVNNGEAADTVRFDPLGRPTTTVTVMDGRRYELNSTYAPEGPRTRLQMVAPWSRSVDYTYDGSLRLAGLRDLGGSYTSVSYNADGLPQKVTLPTTAAKSLSYTPQHLPSSMRYNISGLDRTLGTHFGYDNVNRITSRSSAYQDSTRYFQYDPNDQLTGYSDWEARREWVCDGGDGTARFRDDGSCYWAEWTEQVGERAYSYDVVGNRTDSGAAVEAGSNRYTAMGDARMEWDLEGNLVRKYRTDAWGNLAWEQRLTWNSLGQLTSVYTSGAGTVTYGYDGFGRRVRRDHEWNGRVRYLYDGDDLLMEVDGSGNLLREYTFYPGVDQPHSVRQWQGGQNGATYYYATDLPGHVTGLFNASNQLVNEYRYEPWGAPEAGYPKEAVTNPLRYMGREQDPTTGLYFVRNRWYDVDLGRWISEDPAGLEGGSTNPYVYVGNSPTNFTDPSGLCELWAVVRITYYSDGSEDWEVLGYYWKGDDCGGGESRGGGGGGGGGEAPAKEQEDQCKTPLLSPLRPTAHVTYGPNARGVFAPSFANSFSSAVEELNRLGITPRINSAFRTPADQARMQSGGSGSNPAASLSLHQAGYAVDINGTRSSQFRTIREVMGRHGFTWGGTFNDPPHFEINPFGPKGARGSRERAQYNERLRAAANAANAYYNQCQ